MTELTTVARQAFQDGYREAYARELFTAFRSVFAAECLTHRAVFWAENVGDRVVVRQVKNLRRARKSEDMVLGMTIPDLPAVKILIGNFAAGCKLTTTRWEIYRDFALSERAAQGRFDYGDFVADVSLDERKALMRRGIYPKGDWDFDGILLTHRCPLCGGVFNRTSVIYVSRPPCESCGREIPLNLRKSTVLKLINTHQSRKRLIAEHWEPSPSGEAIVQDFIDPVANSVAFWPIEEMESNLDFRGILDWFGGCYEDFTELYNRSLFRLIACKEFERCFAAFLRRTTNGSGNVLVKSLVRVSERFSPEWLERCKSEGVPATDVLDMRMAVQCLPAVINELILNHGKLQPRKEKRK